MSTNNFLSFLQQILTMVDPDDICSISLAKTAFTAVAGIAESSHKVDKETLHLIEAAEKIFWFLVDHKDDFVGVPGEYQINQRKREKLKSVIVREGGVPTSVI